MVLQVLLIRVLDIGMSVNARLVVITMLQYPSVVDSL